MSQKIKSENLCASMRQQNSVEYFLQFVAVFCHVIARKLYKKGTCLLSCDHKEWYRDTNLLTRLWWNLTRSPDLTRFKSSLSQGEREGWWEGGRRGDSLSFALFLPITLGALFVHASRFASPTSDPNRRDCVTRRCDTNTIFQGKKRHTQRTKLVIPSLRPLSSLPAHYHWPLSQRSTSLCSVSDIGPCSCLFPGSVTTCLAFQIRKASFRLHHENTMCFGKC